MGIAVDEKGTIRVSTRGEITKNRTDHLITPPIIAMVRGKMIIATSRLENCLSWIEMTGITDYRVTMYRDAGRVFFFLKSLT